MQLNLNNFCISMFQGICKIYNATKLFAVYLKFKFNFDTCILSGHSNQGGFFKLHKTHLLKESGNV